MQWIACRCQLQRSQFASAVHGSTHPRVPALMGAMLGSLAMGAYGLILALRLGSDRGGGIGLRPQEGG